MKIQHCQSAVNPKVIFDYLESYDGLFTVGHLCLIMFVPIFDCKQLLLQCMCSFIFDENDGSVILVAIENLRITDV